MNNLLYFYLISMVICWLYCIVEIIRDSDKEIYEMLFIMSFVPFFNFISVVVCTSANICLALLYLKGDK